MNFDGSNKILLNNNSEPFVSSRFPQWSPDSTKMVFNSGTTGEYNIWIINSDGTDQVRIGEGMAPRWSPKGDKIAFMELKNNRFSAL
jgi:Tol biopolymer transport system component